MAKNCLFWGSVLASFCLQSLVWAAKEQVLLLGEQKSLPVSAGTHFSIGNPEVLQVKSTALADGRIILLVKAKALGYSDLLLFSPEASQQDLSFRVVAKKPDGNLGSIPAKLTSVQRGKIQKELDSRLVAAGLGQIHARGVGESILLEGIAHTKQEKEVAELLAQEVHPAVHSYVRLPFEGKEILNFKVQILELIKSREEHTGLEWSDGIPSILKLHQSLLKGEISLEASLHALARTGLVKILSEPELTLNEEGVAELKVGGEIPIAVKSLHFSYVQWKSYGLSLHLQVPGVAEQRARTNIQVEITSLDIANGKEGVPGIKLNRLETVVDLPIGKPIFLSGLLQDQRDQEIKSVPLLGEIPVLGALFRSKNFQERKSELVIALTARRSDY